MRATNALVFVLAFASIMSASLCARADEDDVAIRIGATRAALGTNWEVGDFSDLMKLDGCRREVLAPTVGLRYFPDEYFGFEVNMALPRFASDSLNTTTPSGRPVSVKTGFPHFWVWGIGFSGLLRPIHTEYVSVVVVPDVNFTVAGGRETTDSDSAYLFTLDYRGTRLDAGARLAIEFGPFGSVALQLNAGYYIGYQYLSTDIAKTPYIFRTNHAWYRAFIKDDVLDTVNAAILFYL